MGQFARIAIGGFLVAVGVCIAGVASFLLGLEFASYLSTARDALGWSLPLPGTPAARLLVIAASGAVSGVLLLLFCFLAGLALDVDSTQWPHLVSVWLLWIGGHLTLWLFPLVFA